MAATTERRATLDEPSDMGTVVLLIDRLRRAEEDGDWTEAGRIRALARALGYDEWRIVKAARHGGNR